ncbi:MarR family transcriptional regulator [Escherichia coli]|nr:MarR family transcriptional regulator [Escherichia coli]CTR57912.1 Uncharacterized protein conserved in archaea [Escherichia coli]CTR69847.1 Uncharacterized protein conserved in archaea [Escherichia coli]CTU71783.1 Uncharacterized protein conserved in archaea [Escherichia coli]CTU78290.1 Uncharacterized protein conserved in archaea [Escherichia coli]
MTVIEHIQENPDCSREDISLALGRSATSISNELSRLLWNGLIVRTGEKNKMILYCVNNLPLSVMFNQLLKQVRNGN